MSFAVPEDCRYLETHEWARHDGDVVRVGISDFAQDELGDVVFVELPDVGDSTEQEADFGVIESIKAVSDLYAPVSGTVAERNAALEQSPELVNSDPYGDGWMVVIDADDPSTLDRLMDAAAYGQLVTES